MESLRAFRKVIEDPDGYVNLLRERKKIIGYCCSYTPEEIIHAAGLHPLRLFGDRKDTSPADRHLQSYCCSMVRGVLSDALSGDLNFLSGAVFPHTCDTIQRLSDIWRMNTSFPFFSDIVLPVKLTTESSREYFEDVLRTFREGLEKAFSITITDDELRQSIRLYNIIRTLLKEVYVLHAANPSLISGKDLNMVARAVMIMDREIAVSMLADLSDDMKKAVEPSGRRKRIMLVGSICTQPDIYTLIEGAGADVVWDDLCTGTRWFEGLVSDDGDPIRAIAERYYSRVICPAKHSSATVRGESLVKSVREHGVHGVIFLMFKFCDPHAFDYPYLKSFLDRENIPSMLLEVEGQLPPEGQLLTRFETFVEMI